MSLPVFIPCHPKDLAILPHCVDSIRRYIRPRVAEIHIIAGDLSTEHLTQLQSLGVRYLHERDLLARLGIRDWPRIVANGADRSGFYLQQVLKYEIHRLVESDHYLVADADTVFTSPVPVIVDGRSCLYRTFEHHEPIFQMYEHLMGYRPARQLSFVAHFMLLRRDLVAQLTGVIQARHQVGRWYEAVLPALDLATVSSFSEFETYGYYWTQHRPDGFTSRRLKNVELPRLPPAGLTAAVLAGRSLRLHSVSFHAYLGTQLTVRHLEAAARRLLALQFRRF